MKKISFAVILLSFNSLHAQDISSNIKLQAEKCVLVKSVQDPANPYDALMGVNAINIFNEVSFMNNASSTSSGKPTFPERNTMISFSFKNDSDKNAVGDQLFTTKQTTSFLSRIGKPIQVNQISDAPFQAVYTHKFEQVKPMRNFTIKASHYVAQITDHWASHEVHVEYKDIQKTPNSSQSFIGKFIFKCNDSERARDILK